MDRTTTTIHDVVKCVVPASTAATATKCPVTNSPAALAGLKVGDQVVSVDGTKITSWDQLISIIEPSAGKTLSMVVLRHGSPIALSVTPVRNLKYVGDTTKTKETGYLGISPLVTAYFKPQTVLDVPGQVGSQLDVGLKALGSYPQKLHSLWQTVFDGKKRDVQGAVGVVGIGRIGGQIADSHAVPLKVKIYELISLLASINLLPLLPLDGGHVAGAVVEAAKRGRARMRDRAVRRRDPSAAVATRPQIFVDTAQMLPVMYAVASVLILVTLLTLYADIVKPINIG